jgi:hypothetical protein
VSWRALVRVDATPLDVERALARVTGLAAVVVRFFVVAMGSGYQGRWPAWGDLVAAPGEHRWPRVGPVEASNPGGAGDRAARPRGCSAGAGLLSSLRASFGRSVVKHPQLRRRQLAVVAARPSATGLAPGKGSSCFAGGAFLAPNDRHRGGAVGSAVLSGAAAPRSPTETAPAWTRQTRTSLLSVVVD